MSPEGLTVQSYYDQNAETEWRRLERHRTEFAVTLRAIRTFLPPPPAAILDIGGGPGRYALTLAGLGYEVTLVDLSAANLALAREKARPAGVTLTAVIQANALDLPLTPSISYDSVLLMGPLYHLKTAEERRQAVTEAGHLLKPGGIMTAAFITRFAPLRYYAGQCPETIMADHTHMERLLAAGFDDQSHGFPSAYFAEPAEIVPLMEGAGFETLSLIGCEGVVAGHEEKINALSGEAWERWVDLNYRLGQEPALYGAADHLLYVGRSF